VSFVKLWIVAALTTLVFCAPSSFAATQAAGPKKDAPAPAATTTTTTATTADDPTTGEWFVAALAILASVAIAIVIVRFVSHAHDIQAGLAAATIAAGGTADTALGDAAGGREAAAADAIAVDGPDQVAVGSAGQFKVEKSVAGPVWSVTGLGSFAQLVKDDGRTFVFTPNEQKDGVKIVVTAGDKRGEKAVSILAAAKAPFVFRVAVRSWGLLVVAVFIVAGAIAMGVTGHLDGSNFVALVAPLAALLGVTAAVSDHGGGGGGSAGGGTPGGGSGEGSSGS
jgi:hypothetical protein